MAQIVASHVTALEQVDAVLCRGACDAGGDGATADDAYPFLHRGAEHMPATANQDCRRRNLKWH